MVHPGRVGPSRRGPRLRGVGQTAAAVHIAPSPAAAAAGRLGRHSGGGPANAAAGPAGCLTRPGTAARKPKPKPAPPGQRPDLAPAGTVLKQQWKTVRRLGAGGFGQIMLAEHTEDPGRTVAIKVEGNTKTKSALKMEVAVLRELNGQACVPAYYGCGRASAYNFVIMQRVGENVSELRKKQPGKRFPPAVGLRVASNMLRAIRVVSAGKPPLSAHSEPCRRSGQG